MALTINSLKRAAWGAARPAVSGLAPGLVLYSTDDANTDVEGSGYFNAATGMLVKGDIIMAQTNLDGTPALWIYIVTSATGAATVTIAEQSDSAT